MGVILLVSGIQLSNPIDVPYVILEPDVAYSPCDTIIRVITHHFTDIRDVMIIKSADSPPQQLTTNVRFLCTLITNFNSTVFCQEWEELINVHPMKEIAIGRPVVYVPIILYSDDTSGNRNMAMSINNSQRLSSRSLRVLRDPKARGCIIPSEARVPPKGLRVS